MSEIHIGDRRGPEGPRGHRGHRGHEGDGGPTGPTGPGSGLTTAAGFFIPDALSSSVSINAQSGQFASATYVGVGSYRVDLNVIPGLTSSSQILATGTVQLSVGGFILTLTHGFSVDHGQINVHITDSAGVPSDQSFVLNASLLGV